MMVVVGDLLFFCVKTEDFVMAKILAKVYIGVLYCLSPLARAASFCLMSITAVFSLECCRFLLWRGLTPMVVYGPTRGESGSESGEEGEEPAQEIVEPQEASDK